MSALSPINTDEATLNRDMATLQEVEALLPATVLTGLETPANLNAAIAQLTQVVSTQQSAVTSALNSGQAGLSQAQGYAADAETLCTN